MRNIFLFIEPTNRCNLTCSFCPWDPLRKDIILKNMTFLEFEYLLNKFLLLNKKKYNLETILLWFRGEPFLNEELFKMISFAKSENIKTVISTNGTLLAENVQNIIDSGLDHLIISNEGITKEIYEHHRKGASFEKFEEGVKKLCIKKSEIGSKLIVELQFMFTKKNINYTNKVKEFADYLGVDNFYFKTINISFAGKNNERIIRDINEWLPCNKKFSRYGHISDVNNCNDIKKKLVPKTFRLFCNWKNGMVITVEGDVLVCCQDIECSIRLGNLFKENFDNIFSKWIKMSSLVAHRKLEICRYCFKFSLMYTLQLFFISIPNLIFPISFSKRIGKIKILIRKYFMQNKIF